ncbi:mas-related G-protein coupled receptor member H-like [Eublepharis macularius]|uniref:Mas-related G-protein coupled receptor member H-like n=1 Tax=Eublepharis macularius TaxID=481883 RepID=A0AA97JQY8_EUBMA|nr:mas-related G-protein coupled receptor member H-like [Eublepharis macularius]
MLLICAIETSVQSLLEVVPLEQCNQTENFNNVCEKVKQFNISQSGLTEDGYRLNNQDTIMSTPNASAVTPTAEQRTSIYLNDTEFDDEYDPYLWGMGFVYMVNIVTAFSCLAGLVGNVKVIWLLSFCIKRNPFTTYILNLAVADLGTLLSVLAYAIMMVAIRVLMIIPYILFGLVDSLVFFTHSTSLYLLTAISLEKCLSVMLPIWYRCHRPERTSAVVAFLLWILSGLLCGILLSCYFQESHCRMILNTLWTLNFLICTPAMIASSLTALITICCNSQRHQPPRLYVAILITLLVFLTFGTPLSISYLFYFNSEYFPLEALEVAYLCASVNSSVNPLIYYLVGRDRKRQSRESLKVAFQRLFKEEADPREGS